MLIRTEFQRSCVRNKIVWSDTKIELCGLNSKVMSERNRAALITYPIPSQKWSIVVETSCSGGVSQVQGLGNLSGFYSAQDLRLGWMFTFDHDNKMDLAVKTPHECLRDNSLHVLEWPSQKPDLDLIEHRWRDLKMASTDSPHTTFKACCIIIKKTWSLISTEIRNFS